MFNYIHKCKCFCELNSDICCHDIFKTDCSICGYIDMNKIPKKNNCNHNKYYLFCYDCKICNYVNQEN